LIRMQVCRVEEGILEAARQENAFSYGIPQ
jgi:hypothetical protein